MWRCVDVEMCRCVDVEMWWMIWWTCKMWRCVDVV